jgi:glutamate--cysteine ligase
MTRELPITIEDLDSVIERSLLGSPMALGHPVLGVEYERLLLHRETRRSAPLGFCQGLLAELQREFDAEPVLDGTVLKGLRGDGFALSMEPGGQLEIAVPPMPDLHHVDLVIGRVTEVIETVLGRHPYELVPLGHAPVTPVAEIGLLPRQRYRIMDKAMPVRGMLSRNMMRATAGFQLTYDVADRVDAGRKLALLYRLTPVLMAMTANSRQVGGRDSGYASYRHRVWWDTDSDRSGVPIGSLYAETAVDGYRDFAKRARVLFRHGRDGLIETPAVPLQQLVGEGVITADDVALHLSSLFPFVRLRNYIEVRCFDSVPWDLARSVLALVSGLVYCEKAFAAAEASSTVLLVDDPAALRAFHLDAARHALDAAVPGDPAARLRDIAGDLVGFSGATLGGSNCGWATPADLEAVRRVIDVGVAERNRCPGGC